jgi:hypothetical protein
MHGEHIRIWEALVARLSLLSRQLYEENENVTKSKNKKIKITGNPAEIQPRYSQIKILPLYHPVCSAAL